jgi:hypothetical protein
MTNSLANYCKNNSQIISFVAVCLIIVTIVFLMSKGSSTKLKLTDTFDSTANGSMDSVSTGGNSDAGQKTMPIQMPQSNGSGPVPVQSSMGDSYASITDASSVIASTMNMTPSDLLPNSGNTQFSSLSPNSSSPNLPGGTMERPKTIHSPPLKNANQTIRSEPIIVNNNSLPCPQSTIERDSMRRSLEIGN